MPEIVVLPHAGDLPRRQDLRGDDRRVAARQPARPGHRASSTRARSPARARPATCIVREGFDSLPPSSEDEDDLLDRAWGLTPRVAAVVPGDRRRREARRRDSAVHDQPRRRRRMTMKWTDTPRDRDRARRRASGRRSAHRALHRPAQLGAARCRASTTTRSTAARRSSRRSRWRGSTRPASHPGGRSAAVARPPGESPSQHVAARNSPAGDAGGGPRACRLPAASGV